MSAPMIGPDGREYVSVVVGQNRTFARTCVRVLSEESGRDHGYYLGWKSFWVTPDIVAKARQRLEQGEHA